ncbi:hypothetical protein BX667DRAFT_509538 [Coemansia mojavensis]|nr:hypothetical protein BX667DRAFT_509538 [Coemansia mojavensis]
MNFSNIPEDILLLILKPIITSQGGWKQQLELLSVNSSWRKYMLSTVYSSLIVFYNKQSEPTATNIELVASNGYMGIVRKLVIEISLTTEAVTLLPAIQLLQKYASIWPTIKALSINYVNNISLFCYRTIWQDSLWTQNKEAVDILVDMLPNIVFLQLDGHGAKIILDIYKRIANSYSEQLNKLVCNHPEVTTSQQHYFERLEHAKVYVNSRDVDCPLEMSVDNLKTLELYELPTMFSWMCFANKPNKKVEFPRLKVLKLHSENRLKTNIENFEILDDSYKVYFPQLRCLEIVPQAEQYPLLELGVFNNTLEHIYIHGTLDALETIYIPNMPQAKHMSINVAIPSCRHMSKIIGLLGELASTASTVSCVKLTVYDKEIMTNPSNIDGSILTNLYLKVPINARCTLYVLQTFPNLEELEISQVFCDDSVKEVLNSNLTSPLHAKLVSLIYGYHLHKQDNSQFAVEFLHYLQLRLPQLLRVTANHGAHKLASQFYCHACVQS